MIEIEPSQEGAAAKAQLQQQLMTDSKPLLCLGSQLDYLVTRLGPLGGTHLLRGNLCSDTTDTGVG